MWMPTEQHIDIKDGPLSTLCSCGNTFTTGSTFDKEQIVLEVCSKCHPFYTGTQKIVDTAGRVDRFRQKYGLKNKDNKNPDEK